MIHLRARQATIGIEEEVCRYVPPDNGAGPMWTPGNTRIVRYGGKVVRNVRWTLFQRDVNGWALRARGDGTHEREPCPPMLLPEGQVLLSVNPSSTQAEELDPAAPSRASASCSTRVVTSAAIRRSEMPGQYGRIKEILSSRGSQPMSSRNLSLSATQLWHSGTVRYTSAESPTSSSPTVPGDHEGRNSATANGTTTSAAYSTPGPTT